MLLGYNQLTNQTLLKDYVAQRYALRWWFPQEWYMDGFIPNHNQTDANGAIINGSDGQPLQMGHCSR